MRPVYSFEHLKMEHIQKETYKVPGKLGLEVFPVLVDNAIGTTYDNSISLIRFKNNSYKIDVLKKNFSTYVSGVSVFLPVFSSDVMGYIQARRFLLFNLNDSTHKYYNICNRVKEHLIDVDVFDYAKKQFAFKTTVKKEGWKKRDFMLHIMDLSTDEPKILKTYMLSKDGDNKLLWEKTIGRSFVLYNLETERYVILDSEFQPTTHPLVKFLNEHRDFKGRALNVFQIHPTLPFAIIMGRTKLWVASWKDNKPDLIPIIYKPKLAYNISISLDGKWVMYGETRSLNQIGRDTFYYYVMPVDETLPYYLGDPISLGKDEDPDEVLWTINPTSFVTVSQFSHISRWVLE